MVNQEKQAKQTIQANVEKQEKGTKKASRKKKEDNTPKAPKLYSTTEIARLTGIHKTTIANWFWKGRVPNAMKLGSEGNGRWVAYGQDIFACMQEHGWKGGNPFEE